MSDDHLEKAYRYCESVTRDHAKSFYFAAKFLPRFKQRAVFAVYALCRHVDDEIDEAGFKSEGRCGRCGRGMAQKAGSCL